MYFIHMFHISVCIYIKYSVSAGTFITASHANDWMTVSHLTRHPSPSFSEGRRHRLLFSISLTQNDKKLFVCDCAADSFPSRPLLLHKDLLSTYLDVRHPV